MSQLRFVFGSALSAALAVTLATAGCSSSAAPGGTDDAGVYGDAISPADAGPDPRFDGASCGVKGVVGGLASVTVAKPFDYLELRYVSIAGGTTAEEAMALEALGVKCANATDSAACLAALERNQSTSLFPRTVGDRPSATYLVHQRGDTVTDITTKAELLAFLGSIDHPAKARLVVEVAGYSALCTDGSVVETANGYRVFAKKSQECLNQYTGHVLDVARDGTVTPVESVDLKDETKGCAVAGRRPEGFALPARIDGDDDVLAYLAEMRALEAASVPAFERLAAELAAHGAPASLVRRADAAARDEVRHAAAFAGLRARRGAPCDDAAVSCVSKDVRDLEAIAIENAIEGCVRETFGALVAGYQAEVADDPAMRRLFATIAEDETRHAELAWDVAAWLDGRLDEPSRERVRAARLAAVDELFASAAGASPSAALVRASGLPARSASRALLDGIAPLWAA